MPTQIDPWKSSKNLISLNIREPLKDEQGNLQLGSLISKENLDLFLFKAKGNPDYEKSKEKFEFRVKQSKGQVFLQLKKRNPGFFGKICSFVGIGRGRRTAERNDAMFALAKFRGLGFSDLNRLTHSRSTGGKEAKDFREELEGARNQALKIGKSNRLLWTALPLEQRQEMLATAARRNDMGSFLGDINEHTALEKPMFKLESHEDRELTQAEAIEIAEKTLDRYWASQKEKIELLEEMGLTGLTAEQQYALEKELIKAGVKMEPSFFEGAKADAALLANSLKKLASTSADSLEQRRAIVMELMSQLKNAAQARGLNGLQEFGELAPLVAYAAKGMPENGLEAVANLRETLNFVTEVCADIQFSDSSDYEDIAIPAGHLARISAFLSEDVL
jgi:hypothetical protein